MSNDLTLLTDAQLVEFGAMLDARISADKKELDAVKEILRARGAGEYFGRHYMAVVGNGHDQWTVDKEAIFKAFAPKRNAPKMDEWFKQFSKVSHVSPKVSFKPAPLAA